VLATFYAVDLLYLRDLWDRKTRHSGTRYLEVCHDHDDCVCYSNPRCVSGAMKGMISLIKQFVSAFMVQFNWAIQILQFELTHLRVIRC
jgi:hypothetical protein